MTFSYKLSRRLARLGALLALLPLALLACEMARNRGTDPSPIDIAQLLISPTSVVVYTDQTVDFVVVGLASSGDTVATELSWSAASGTITSTSQSGGRKVGHYRAGRQAGQDRVIVRDSSGLADTADVTVTSVPVAWVEVSPSSGSVPAGQTLQLSAAVKDSAGAVLAGRLVTWASSNLAIATVSENGLVTGLLAGSAVITATSEGKSGTAEITVVTPPPPGTRTGWYAAPTGSSSGTGRSDSPWDLRTALSGGNGKVQPGDTVWVRGGTYNGSFTASLTGTSAAPIIVRAYPGERAIIDGNGSSNSTFVVDGSWAVYWGLEIMNSMTARFGDGLGLRPTGVYVRNAANVKLINLIVHDTGHGTYTEYAAQNIEIYGWIIFNGGHQNSTRSDGHGIYIKHDGAGGKVVRDNIIFNQFGFGIHGYTESSGALRNLVFEGNVLFNNGELSNDDNPNLQLGGNRVADNDLIADNMTYFSPGHGWWNFRIGYNSLLNGTAVVRNNYVVGGGEVVEVGYWQNLDWLGNTFVGDGNMVRANDPSAAGQEWGANTHYRDPAAVAWRFNGSWRTFDSWRQASGWGTTDQAMAGVPTATRVFVRPNLYEPGRATVVIYNWARSASVGVDLGGVVPVGHVYEIRNVQTIFGAPVASGTYTGGLVSFPMDGVAAQAPIGGSPNPPLRTGPDFDVFVVTSRAP
ncbi:MAG TPA: Ig-like domain-containing protein [Gemmatimonadales bacterium]|nr:Ig-like domain-containing protein [Gemmatimonadales bacterium]